MYDLEGRRPEEIDVALSLDVRIPMRDGVALSAALYRCADPKPRPVIATLTIYTSQFHHEAAVFFAANGFHFLSVDVRGRGNSEGALSIGSEDRDGADCVEWIAQQEFCDGRVALWGGSYSGYTQWRTAQARPAELATMIPVAAPWRGLDSPMRNNIFSCDRVQWLALIRGRTLQDRLFADERFWTSIFKRHFESGAAFRELDRLLGNASPEFQEWLGHPTLDDYWHGLNPGDDDYSAIDLPILSITGFFDADQAGALEHFRRHCACAHRAAADKHFLVIGPWDHSGTRRPKSSVGGFEVGQEALVDMAELDLAWYRWTFDRGERPDFLANRITYFVIGPNSWRHSDRLEDITARTTDLYLDCGAGQGVGLTLNPPHAPAHQGYHYDPSPHDGPTSRALSDRWSLVQSRVAFGMDSLLLFESEPFQSPTEVCGTFACHLWLEINQPDTDFEVTIEECDADGEMILKLGSDIQRARHREGLSTSKLANPGEVYLYRFEGFAFIAREIPVGHRLRLIVGPIESVFMQCNRNSAVAVADQSLADSRAVIVTLHTGPERPSRLVVPLGANSYQPC